MITLKINVSDIDKAKLFKGQKGVYLNAVLIETPNSEYSDYMIVQETTKEEREAGVKGAILGNAKELKFEQQTLSEEEQDDLPF
jgi:DNA-binding cell septation regulator SpoVG